jgi:ABC-type dipeptide/oligopeptide/nickel transport system ATPase component
MMEYCKSGRMGSGRRQRVMIARAICLPARPTADEPTTTLDARIQAQIRRWRLGLQQALAMSPSLITHDLGLVAEFCDQVVVMYAGMIVERHRSINFAAIQGIPKPRGQSPYFKSIFSAGSENRNIQRLP